MSNKAFTVQQSPVYYDTVTKEPVMNVAGKVNVVDSDGDIVSTFGGLLKIKQGDAIVPTFPDTTTEVYTVKVGGVSGTTVCVLTVVYTTSAKTTLSSITSVIY